MSSYVFMKVLESAPERYDRGIRWLSGGGMGAAYDRVAEIAAGPGRRVLDVGCGTGGVSLACAARGADVTGIDLNDGMLDVARRKAASSGAADRIRFLSLGAMEIEDRFEESSLDAVVSSLCLSELLPEEQGYVLRTARARLRPGGVIVLVDEERPRTLGSRLRRALVRVPVAAATWLLTQTTTRQVGDLAGLLREAGFTDVRSEPLRGDLVLATGKRPEEEPS